MTKITQIQDKIRQINSALFQQLCDAYIYKKFGYQNIKTIGTVIGKEKTRIGTPDTGFRKSDDRYIFAEYTTQADHVANKLLEDLEKCFDEDKTSIPTEGIDKVFLCHNGKLSYEEDNLLLTAGQDNGVKVEIIDIDQISWDLFLKYTKLAKEFLNVEIDTGQILDTSDFVAEYQKNRFATPLDTDFYFRKVELTETLEKLENTDLIVIDGKAGVGKSRFALEVASKFIEDNSTYQDYCIFNREGISLYNDLKDYFSDDGNYLILIDDANRVSELQHILSLLKENSARKNYKIILTVRDYAVNKVTDLAREYNFEKITIEPLEEKQIREFISEEFEITNPLYLERIENISKGNPRIAVMAARIAKEANRLDSIYNIEEIYEEYFSFISDNFKSLEGQNLLKTAGIISFFRLINLTDYEFLAKIENSFGISPDAIKETSIQLHKMEVVELYEDEVVKISDQILATFLFHKVFIKENNLLNFSILLKDYFESHRNLFVDSVYPAADVFDRDFIREKLKPSIDEEWMGLKSNEDTAINFIDTFFPFMETESIVFLKEKINALETELYDPSKLNFEPEENNSLTDKYLKTMRLFRQATLDSFKYVVELIFVYLEKCPIRLPQGIYLFNKHFSFQRHSHLDKYIFEVSMIESLLEKLNGNEKKELYKGIFLKIAGKFLKMSFRSDEWKGMKMVLHTFGLLDSKEINALRENIWEQLFRLYEQPEYKSQVLDVIANYSHNWRAEENNPAIAEKDKSHIIPFIENNLDPESYFHCEVVQDYLIYLEKLKIPFSEELKETFTSDVYKISEIILDKGSRIYTDVGFDDLDKKKLELVKSMLGDCQTADYQKFIDYCSVVIESNKSRDVWQFEGFILTRLEDLAENDTGVFKEVIKYIINNGNSLSIGNSGIYRLIRNVIEVYGVKETYGLLDSKEFNLKAIWLSSFFSVLKSEEINDFYLEKLNIFYKESPNMLVDLEYLKNYLHLDKNIIIKVIKIIWERIQTSEFYFDFFYLLQGDLNSDLKTIFAKDLPLLKEIYFYQMSHPRHKDYRKTVFQRIFEMDNHFAIEYLEWLYEKNEYLSDYDKSENFSFIWESVNVEELMNEIVELGYQKSKDNPLFYYRNYIEIYLGSNEEDGNQKILDFLKNYISEYTSELDKICYIFKTICDVPQLQGEIYSFLEVFLEKNKNAEDFLKLPMEATSSAWSGSIVPMYENKIKFYESLLPLFQGLNFVNHKSEVEKYIRNLKKTIQQELKREFVEAAFR